MFLDKWIASIAFFERKNLGVFGHFSDSKTFVEFDMAFVLFQFVLDLETQLI